MSDLQRADVIRGERSPNSREKLYRVTDRVFVHYYRLRQGSKTAQSRPLEAILDFLEAFYTPEEKRFQTLAYLEQGRLHEAKTFNRIAQNGMQRAESSYTLDMPSIDEALSLDLGTIGAAERQHWNNLLETDPLKAYQDAGPETLQSDVASAMIRAQALVRIGLPDKSYELLLDAISQSNLPNEKIILLFELSRLKISVLRKSSEAASYLNNALSSITFSDLSESNKGLFLRLSGWVDYKFGHTDKAIEKFEEGLRIIEGGQDPSVEVLLLEMLTACQIRKNDYGKAADFASKTIAVSKTCQKDFARYSRIAYGFAMHKMGQLESALTAYDEAADFSFKLGAFADYAECMKFKILTLETLGRRDEIWETHDRLREAANITNDVSVLRELGEALSASRLIDERAFEYLRSAVEAGDGAACHQLGVAYLNGRGVGRDPTMAFKLFALGDEYENSRATVYLAECFFRGLGTDNDDKKGFELLTKASANGNAQAMRARGVCFRDGLGVDPDADEAFRNFERAVEAGDDNALLYLGDCYQKGIGTKPNEDLAFFYFERAASVGNSHARTLVQAREALKALKRSSSETASVHVAWAKDHVATLGKCEFVDVPLVDLDWHEVTPGSAEARAVLAAVHEAVSLNGDLETLSGATCEALRQAPLLFYPGYRLVDLQLSWADDSKREPMILSAICGEHGAVLLDGTSPPIHAINQDLLTLPSPEIAQNYLSFFCAYVRGEEGPFYLARDVDELGLQRQVEDLLPEDVLKAGFKLTIRSDGADKDDSFRFDAVVFYSNALFKAKFKVQPTGMVEMEDDEPIAADLPSVRRRFNGPLRSRKYTFKEWVAHLEDRAKKGDPQAMLDLAEAIRDDGDGDGDHHEAIEWYTRASISGSDEVSIRSLKQTAFLFAKLGDLTAAQRAATRMFTMAQASGELKNVVSAHFLRVQLSAYGEDIEAVQSFEKACDIIVEDQITDVGKASNYIEELLVGASISGKTEEVLSALSQKKELILSEKTTPSFTKSSGQRLAEYSVPLGRSQASEIITNFVRSAHVFIQSLPEELQDETWLQDVFSGFAEHCHQSDFLRDISLILTAEKISEDQMLPEMLNAIAAVDEAKKPKTVLARMDPDLATMVRKIRGIEEI
jgi:TPR repeat protein